MQLTYDLVTKRLGRENIAGLVFTGIAMCIIETAVVIQFNSIKFYSHLLKRNTLYFIVRKN